MSNKLDLTAAKRVSFVFETLKFANELYRAPETEFHYFNTGKNMNDHTRKMNGLILPVEEINSSVLAIRVVDKDTNQKTLLISSINPFSGNSLRRLIGLSHSLCSDWATRTTIAFPDFSNLEHANITQQVKASFEDQKSTSGIEVQSYSSDFRNLRR